MADQNSKTKRRSRRKPRFAEAWAAWLKEIGAWPEFQSIHRQKKKELIPSRAYDEAVDEMCARLSSRRIEVPKLDASSLMKDREQRQSDRAGYVYASSFRTSEADLSVLPQSDILSDMEWVYVHILVKDVKESDAPSPGAWGLLKFARDNPKDFYSAYMQSKLKTVAEQQGGRGVEEDARYRIAEINNQLAAIREHLQERAQADRGKPAVPLGASEEGGEGL